MADLQYVLKFVCAAATKDADIPHGKNKIITHSHNCILLQFNYILLQTMTFEDKNN